MLNPHKIKHDNYSGIRLLVNLPFNKDSEKKVSAVCGGRKLVHKSPALEEVLRQMVKDMFARDTDVIM
ncbi:hypothetical protein JTE90_002391 [Oedothorax gibbosus]|uniref:Uncharacterized protein n=1 Tax=Oedothorax gibbosus TaxID=931172 RepID=A0AAV6VBZ8_9ARAC|nr:hypothetical protein JTE90_002391 [Oedothorax gibbosus]